MEDGGSMTVAALLIWVLLGGTLGGCIDFLRRLEYREAKLHYAGEEIGPSMLCWMFLFNSVIGLGGALAIQFAFVLLKSFSTEATVENVIFLLSVSVAAGFGARRLLPRLVDRLEERVQDATNKAEQASAAAHDTKIAIERTEFLARILASLREGAPASEVDFYLSTLLDHVRQSPTDRRAAILLGRLYRKKSMLEEGISSLTTFLTAKEGLGELDHDYADVLYNRACYHALLFASSKNAEHQRQALADLQRSVALSPGNATDAASEQDFVAIRDAADFPRPDPQKSP